LQRDSENHEYKGISTLQSYRVALIFEILGLNKVFHKYFPYTPSRIEGIGLIEVEKKIKKISKSFPNSKIASLYL
jgi:glutamate synthase (ferredoxin)